MTNARPSRRMMLAAAAGGAIAAPVAATASASAQTIPQASARPDRIRRVTATPLRVPIVYPYAGANVRRHEHCCHVEVETESGIVGHGITGIVPDMRSIAAIVNITIAPDLMGEDALRHEAIWNKMYWTLTPRGQSGFQVHAMSAVDIALWDIRAKTFGVSVSQLIGGAREKAPLYMTFGAHILDRDQLVAAGRELYRRGFDHLKIVVGFGALRNRDTLSVEALLAEDVARVRAVRRALGDGAKLHVDANCNLDYPSAHWLIEALRPYNITFFEEPLRENDAHLMAELRRNTGVVLAAGQNEGRASRFRDLLVANAIDYAQPNVMNSGGFTQALRIAGMAESFNVPIANGGAAGAHNAHFHCGLAHGGRVEWHATFMEMCKQVYTGITDPTEPFIAPPPGPGLGFSPNQDAIREFTMR